MGGYLGRDAILRPRALRTEEVRVPEWADPESGADVVLVQEMTGRERDEYEMSLTAQRGGKSVPDARNVRAKLVVRSVVDPDSRKPLFNPEDVDMLGELSAAALDRVAEVAGRLSGLSEQDLDELGKPSQATPGGDSSSA